MALIQADRVRETSTTSGTGAMALSGAVVGYQSFSATVGAGNTCYYVIATAGSSDWEVGLGTVGSNTLARTTVYASSNGGGLVNFSSAQKDVLLTLPAEKAVVNDGSTYGISISGNAATATNATNATNVSGGTISSPNDATIHGLTVGQGANSIADNTAVGFNALSGVTATNTGSNTAIGYRAGQSIKGASFPDGLGNTAIGYSVMAQGGGLTGYYNTGVGYQSLLTTSTGYGNTGVGASSGSSITTGNNNVILGSYTGSAAPISATRSNYIVLSDGAGNVRQYIDNNGNFVQKVTGTAPTLATNSTMTFELTSNTSLKISVRGTDGTTRSVSLTLA